jgi:hypothetical protein
MFRKLFLLSEILRASGLEDEANGLIVLAQESDEIPGMPEDDFETGVFQDFMEKPDLGDLPELSDVSSQNPDAITPTEKALTLAFRSGNQDRDYISKVPLNALGRYLINQLYEVLKRGHVDSKSLESIIDSVNSYSTKDNDFISPNSNPISLPELRQMIIDVLGYLGMAVDMEQLYTESQEELARNEEAGGMIAVGPEEVPEEVMRERGWSDKDIEDSTDVFTQVPKANFISGRIDSLIMAAQSIFEFYKEDMGLKPDEFTAQPQLDPASEKFYRDKYGPNPYQD